MEAAVEDFWARSSEILQAHKESLWACKEGILAQQEYLWACSSQSFNARKENLIKSHENLKLMSSELLASITVTISLEQSHAQGLIVNISGLLYERQRLLADQLRNSLTSNLKLFILFFLFFGARGYVQTEAADISLLFFMISVAAYFAHRVSSSAAKPVLFYKESEWMDRLIELCPFLLKPYKPTKLWGWSGHMQTAILGKMGRSVNPLLPMVRRSFKLEDGSTIYYDTFEPVFQTVVATVIVAPGINNTSEKLYIKTFVRSCLAGGYRVVVLNHLGSLHDIPVTTPRIFGYGHTGDLARLVEIVHEKYRPTPMFLVGFSMGGNIVGKYLGEEPERQKMFVAAISVCQGYDINKNSDYLLSWTRLGRLYNWAITNDALKSTMKRHSKIMRGIYDTRKVAASTCIQDFDACVMSKMYKFKTVEEMYKEWSSAKYLEQIKIPLMMLNAVDDPIIAPVCNDIPIRVSCQNERVLHVQTQCGGHLGFYTGGWIIPKGLSWMDTSIVEYMNAVMCLTKVQDEDMGACSLSDDDVPECSYTSEDISEDVISEEDIVCALLGSE